MTTKQPSSVSSSPVTDRHLYMRGWLGLIPVVGVVVGIYLAGLGWIKYRDKKLVLIGIAGILFTFLFFGSTFYYGAYSKEGRTNKAAITQDIVNSLVKDLEFYRLQNGNYPDSLEQLKANNEHVIVVDPMSYRFFENAKNLHYQRVDSTYMLFSIGIDMKPSTKDDIYPTVTLKKRDSTTVSGR